MKGVVGKESGHHLSSGSNSAAQGYSQGHAQKGRATGIHQSQPAHLIPMANASNQRGSGVSSNSNHHQKTHSHGAVTSAQGSYSQRKSSQNRTGPGSNAMSKPTTTAASVNSSAPPNSAPMSKSKPQGVMSQIPGPQGGHHRVQTQNGQPLKQSVASVHQTLAAITQYGLAVQQQSHDEYAAQRDDSGASETFLPSKLHSHTQYSNNNQAKGPQGYNLATKSAKTVMSQQVAAQGSSGSAQHSKTKSQQITEARGGSYTAQTGSKLTGGHVFSGQQQPQPHHQRHSSNPSWVLLQGGGKSAQAADPNMQRLMGDHGAHVSENIDGVSKTRAGAKLATESYQGVEAQHQVAQSHHRRFNSSKSGATQSQLNHAGVAIYGQSKIQKAVQNLGGKQASSSVQDAVNQSVNVTATGGNISTLTTGGKQGGAGAAVSTSVGGVVTGQHKKASSMANSKITQLLLKAGSKHYVKSNLQAAGVLQASNVTKPSSQRLAKPNLIQSSQAQQTQQTVVLSQVQHSLPQKQRISGAQAQLSSSAIEQSNMMTGHRDPLNPHVFISSYDVPKRSANADELLPSEMANLASMNSGSEKRVYANINKSMDMVTSAFNGGSAQPAAHLQLAYLEQQQAHQKQKEKQTEAQLQRMLREGSVQDGPGGCGGASTRHEVATYQEHLSKYLVSKAVDRSHNAALTSADMVAGASANGSSEATHMSNKHSKLKAQSAIDERSTSIEVQQQQTELQGGSQRPQGQPLLFAQQLNAANQQINSSGLGHQSMADKIIRQGKVISSAGVAVKKPAQTAAHHSKNLSSVTTSQGKHAPSQKGVTSNKLGQHGTHQRTKSDQVGSDFTLIINMGKVIQNQKGKVGEILKNNFVEGQQQNPAQKNAHGDKTQTPAPQVVTNNAAKQMRTYTGGERSKAKDSIGADFSNQSAQMAALSQKQISQAINDSGAVISKTKSFNTRRQSNASTKGTGSAAPKKAAISQAKNRGKTMQEKYEELEFKYNELLEQIESKKGEPVMRSTSPIDTLLQREEQQSLRDINGQGSTSTLSSKATTAGISQHYKQQAVAQMNPRMVRYLNNQQKMLAKGASASLSSDDGTQQSVAHSQPREAVAVKDKSFQGAKYQPNLQNPGKKATTVMTRTADARSADLNAVKHQTIDMSHILITNPFDESVPVPPQSKQVSVPPSSTSQSAPQYFIADRNKRTGSTSAGGHKTHARVNTHYYGQQVVVSAEDPSQMGRAHLQKPNESTSLDKPVQIAGAEIIQNKKDQVEILSSLQQHQRGDLVGQQQPLLTSLQSADMAESDPPRPKGQRGNSSSKRGPVHGHSHSMGQPASSSFIVQAKKRVQNGSNAAAVAIQRHAGSSRYQVRQQHSHVDLTTSKTQQTPRTTNSQSTEQVERAIISKQKQRLQASQACAAQAAASGQDQDAQQNMTNLNKHSRMLWQNLVTMSHDLAEGQHAAPASQVVQTQIPPTSQQAKYTQGDSYTAANLPGHHRRSVSDGNDPKASFVFNQGQEKPAGTVLEPSIMTDHQSKDLHGLSQMSAHFGKDALQRSVLIDKSSVKHQANKSQPGAGKASLASHQMQQRSKRLEQHQSQVISGQRGRAGKTQGSSRSLSRSKKQTAQQSEALPPQQMNQLADVCSLESADNHQQPNAQFFGQITHDRKINSKKTAVGSIAVSKAPQTSSLTKESFTGAAPKKNSKKGKSSGLSTSLEAGVRSSSKGPPSQSSAAVGKLDLQKKAHGHHHRIKSNSYRVSNGPPSLKPQAPTQQQAQDTSLITTNQSTNLDPSMEGSIQNPSNVILNGRFIEMAANVGSGGVPHAQGSLLVPRGSGAAVTGSRDTKQLAVDMTQTKERQMTQESQRGVSKRTFHHPALSQPSAAQSWMLNHMGEIVASGARASQEMFIVQESTPVSTYSVDDGHGVSYPAIPASKNQNPNQRIEQHHSPLVAKEQQSRHRQNQPQDFLRNSLEGPTASRGKSKGSHNDRSKERLQQVTAAGKQYQVALKIGGGKESTGGVKKTTLSIEKKRGGLPKNQAQRHPICQPNNGAGHIKNKLSNVSEEPLTRQHQREKAIGSRVGKVPPVIVSAVATHKRHKSDIVESQRHSSFQPLITPTPPERAAANQDKSRLPQKQINGLRHGGEPSGGYHASSGYGRKESSKTAQASPLTSSKRKGRIDITGSKQDAAYQNQNHMGGVGGFALVGDEFYGVNDQNDDMKMVNISIDELVNEDDEVAGGADQSHDPELKRRIDRSKWVKVIREGSHLNQQSTNLQTDSYGRGQSDLQQRSKSTRQEKSVDSGNRSDLVAQKRKKFMQAYQKKSEALKQHANHHHYQQEHSGGSSVELPPHSDSSRRFIPRRVSQQPQNAMLIEERTSTEESQLLSDNMVGREPNAKYKNIMSIAKRKFKSKSHIPPHIALKNSTSSLDPHYLQHSADAKGDGRVAAGNPVMRQKYEGIPADSPFRDEFDETDSSRVKNRPQQKIQINMHIPSEIQQVPQYHHQPQHLMANSSATGGGGMGYPNSVSMHSLVDDKSKSSSSQPDQILRATAPLNMVSRFGQAKGSNSSHSQVESKKKGGAQGPVHRGAMQKVLAQNEISTEQFVPLNSLDLQHEASRAGAVPETPPIGQRRAPTGLKAPKASVQKNNFLKLNRSGDRFQEDDRGHGQALQAHEEARIETYSSIEHDSELTAKEKIRKKICKYIRLGLEDSGQVPYTTVDFYRIGKILGKGAFGKVNLALHNLTQQMVAIKSINKQYFGEDSQRKKVLQEVVILKQTRHKHIVRLYEYFETQKHILFVIEIAAGGDLLNYVRKRRQLKEDVAKSVFKQLISGLHYCHSKGILHRDIKLDNILLSAQGEVKICDFGVSKVIKRGEVMTEQCGTPAYIAPEILKDRGYEGFGVDVWSSGVVLYAMLYGIVPFRAGNMNELQKMIIRADYKLQDCISEPARDILTGLLEKDPAKRLTTRQILAHPWMADAKDTVELFTQAEKNYIRSEYTYRDTSRYNRNQGEGGGTNGGLEYESDAFVDAMLDTNENSILKNAETKSVILAPFNSTKSHIETGPEFLDQVRDLLVDRRCVKFAPRVREIAKQYEVNNNAELDNGVQHDFLEEEAKQKAQKAQQANADEGEVQEEEAKRQGTQHSGIVMLDELIKHEESLQMTHRSGSENAHDLADPYNPSSSIHGSGGHGGEVGQSSMVMSGEIGEAKGSLAPHAIQAQQTLVVDDQIAETLVEYGFPREALVHYLNKNELNCATASYWLLQMAAQARESEFKAQELAQAIEGASATAKGDKSPVSSSSALTKHKGVDA